MKRANGNHNSPTWTAGEILIGVALLFGMVVAPPFCNSVTGAQADVTSTQGGQIVQELRGIRRALERCER